MSETVMPKPSPCLCPPQCGEFCTGRCVSAPRFCPDRCDYWEYRANAAEAKVASLEVLVSSADEPGGSMMWTSDHDKLAAEQAFTIDRLKKELLISREPDMFWDADDPETSEDSIREVIYDHGLEVTEIATAFHGPTFFAFLTGDDETEPEVVHVFATREDAETALASLNQHARTTEKSE
jgi:hypothetical protein